MTASGDPVDERRLIEAAQKDPRRFAELYEQNFDRVYAYIARRVHHREQTQDIVSDVFHQAMRNIGRYEWRGVPFQAWLFRIAANAIADHWQGVSKEASRMPLAEPDEMAMGEIERSVMLSQMVDALPADQRYVIVQRFLEQRSIREIAQQLERSEGAIKQLQFRAIENLRDRMGVSHG